MHYFVTDKLGLIVASLNLATFITVVYIFVKAVERRSRVYQVLDKFYGPALQPLRRILPESSIDIASLVVAAILQIVAFYVKLAVRPQ
jgi:uncharacterized protein YggT (Ycf19 family)